MAHLVASSATTNNYSQQGMTSCLAGHSAALRSSQGMVHAQGMAHQISTMNNRILKELTTVMMMRAYPVLVMMGMTLMSFTLHTLRELHRKRTIMKVM